MGQINLKVTLDNSDFKKKIDESTNAIKNSGKTAEEIGKKVQEAINNYSLGAKELLDVAKQNFKEQSQIVKQVAEDIEVMQAKLKNMPPSSAQQELTKDLIAAKQALKEETAILDEKKAALDKVAQAYKENSSQTEKTANKLTTLRTQTRIAREELSKMEQEGLRGTEAYNKLQLKLGKLTDQMNDTQKQARVLADDEKYLTATIQAISGIAGMFSVAQGAVGLFGEENENLQRIMMKVQSLMAITIGLQQVAQVVNKDSAVSILFLSKAQTKLATSLGISTAAAKVFMIAITGGLVIGLMALMALFEKLSQKRKEDEEKTKEQTKAQEEFYKTIGDNAAKSLTEFTILQQQYSKIGDTFAEKNKFLQENKKKYEELGLAIKNVADQENLLIKNKEAYINSVISKAYADAYRADIAKKFAEVIKLENAPLQYKSETKVIKTNEMVFAGDAMVRKTDVVFDEDKTQKNIEAAMNEREKAVSTLKSQIVKDTEKLVDLENKSAEDLRKAGINQIIETKTHNEKKDISSYGKSIADIWQKIYQDIEQAKASSINNEFARTTELNTLNAKKELDELDKQIEIIKQKRIEQAKAEYVNNTGSEKGFVAPIITLTDEEKRTYEERAKQIIDNVYKLNQEAYTQMIGDYQTFEEKRESIRKTYDEKRKTFEREGLTKNIEELNKIEQEELSELDNSFASKQESFVSWLDNITNLTQKQLENQIKIAKKSIENGDLDEKTLAILRVKIKELEAQLKEKKEELKEVDTKDIGFSNVIDKLSDERKKLREELAKGEEADSELIKAYKNNISELSNELYSRIDKVVGKIKLMSSFMKDFADATGEVGKGFSEVVGYADDFVDKIIAGAKAGGAWGAIAGAVVSIATSIMKSIQQTKEEKKELEENELDYQRELNQLYRERAELIAQADNALFGRDRYQSLINYMQLAIQGEAKFNSLIKKWQESIQSNRPTSISDPNAGAIESTFQRYNLIKNGIFDIEKARALLSNGNLTDEVKRELQRIVDEYENYINALKEVEALTAEFVGSIRDDLMSILTDSWRNGTDAVYEYGKAVSKVLENMIMEQAYSLFFSQLFDDLEKQINNINKNTALTPEEVMSAYANAFSSLGEQLQSTMPLAEEYIAGLRETLSSFGYDIFNNSRTATQAQGIQNISQQSADRIDGMLTSVQGLIIDIKDMTGTIRERVISINENVVSIRTHTGDMSMKLDRIDYNINQMVTNGISVN